MLQLSILFVKEIGTKYLVNVQDYSHMRQNFKINLTSSKVKAYPFDLNYRFHILKLRSSIKHLEHAKYFFTC